MRLKLARWLAYTIGVLAPLGDTIRRWGTWQQFPPALLDDYLLGALLVAGAWATRGAPSERARGLLAAAWGFTCAIGYTSAALQWQAMLRGENDPAPVPSSVVLVIKLVGTLLATIALVLTLVDAPGVARGSTSLRGPSRPAA